MLFHRTSRTKGTCSCDDKATTTQNHTESTSPDGNEWGAEGALAYVRSCRDLAARVLVDGLYHEARGFACNGLQQDDITSVIVKVDG